MKEEVAKYIAHAREYGFNDEEIKQHLREAGWKEDVINENFSILEDYSKRTLEFKNSETFLKPSISVTPAKVSELSASQGVKLELRPKETKLYKKILPFFLLGVLVVLSFVFITLYFNLSFFGKSPLSLLLSLSSNNQSVLGDQAFEISYSDNGVYEVPSLGNGIPPFVLNKPSLNLKITNSVDKNNSVSGETKINFSNNNSNYSANLLYSNIADKFYIKIEETGESKIITEFISGFLGQDISGKWLGMKLKTSQKQSLDEIDSKDLVKRALSKGVFKARFSGFGKTGSQFNIKYDLSIDKENFKKFIIDEMKVKPNADEDAELTSAIDHISIKNLSVWFGITNFKVNKLSFESSAPSVTSAAKLFINNYSQDIAKSGDEQRVQDIRQMSLALELYFNDHKGYPEGQNGTPDALFPQYLPSMPVSPAATGNCTDYYNTYWYTTQGNPKVIKGIKVYPSYNLTFCIGQDTPELKAGLGKLTPEGVATTISCPDTERACFTETNRQQQAQEVGAKGFYNDLEYDASLNINSELNQNSNPKDILPPNDFIDLTSIFGGEAVEQVQHENEDSPVAP